MFGLSQEVLNFDLFYGKRQEGASHFRNLDFYLWGNEKTCSHCFCPHTTWWMDAGKPVCFKPGTHYDLV